MNKAAYLSITMGLMENLSIPIRDTYATDANLDDFYSNGNCYGGPRLFSISWINSDDYPTGSANKLYEIPEHKSVAYDAYQLRISNKYKDSARDHPIAHECVHFLQHNTIAEDKSYIIGSTANPVDYIRYLSQRVELEAHLVQVAYILQNNLSYAASVLSTDEIDEVRKMVVECQPSAQAQPTLKLLLFCKTKGLI
jgi:hypothetical protein